MMGEEIVPRAVSAADAGTLTIGGDMVVNRLGYGATRIPGPGVWGEPQNPGAVREVLLRCVALGVNLIDTSDYYGRGVANRWIAETLHPYPPGLVIVTKFGARREDDGSWAPAADPQSLRAACDDNLRNLKLDRLDLVHFRYTEGSGVSLAESLDTMRQLQEEDKIRHVGVSNVNAAQLREAQGIISVASVQNLFNIENRRDEDVLDICTAEGIPFMPFFPLAIGALGRAGGAVAAIAERRGATPAQIAIAWLLARSPMMLPIPGTASSAHLEENVAAASIRLTPAELALLDG